MQEDKPRIIQRPRLVGRHAEWQQIQAAWRDVQTGKSRCVIIWGEAGIGKTRLAEELIDWVQRLGHAWASSRSYATQGALTYAPITEWLRAATVQSALATIDDLWRVELVRLLPELQMEYPELPAPGPLTETWQQQRFFQGIVRALQAVSGPLLLHLDDMQWSDQETLTLLQFILHGAGHHPMLVVGGIRTEDAVENAALAALLEALRHNGHLTELHLTPLSQEETTDLAEQSTETPIPPEMAERLYVASEGHPLFLIETVRGGLTKEALLHGDHAQTTPASQVAGLGAIPSKIYNLIVARLGQLSSTAQQVASIAAVIGRAFTYEVLHEAVSLDELALVDALDELWTQHIIREQAGNSYDFSHDRVREVTYQEISRARRRLLHRQVAKALETIRGDNLDDVSGELASHYAQAGDTKRAYRYYRQAARVALAQHALPHAEAMFDAAISHAPDDPVARIELLQEQNIIFHRSLQLVRWRTNHDNQQAQLAWLSTQEPRLRMMIDLDRSLYFCVTSAGEEAVDAALAAINLAQKLNDKASLAQGYQHLAHGYWMQARMSEARQYFDLSAQYARKADVRAIEALSLEYLAQAGMFSGMPAEQIFDLLTRAFVVAEATGNQPRMAELIKKFAYLRISRGMGEFELAEQEYRRALKLARGSGSRSQEVSAWSNMGVLFIYQGNYRLALDAIATAIELEKEHPHFWRHWIAHHNRGAALMQMGRLDSARAELRNASEQLCALGNHHHEVKARCDLGLLYHLIGEHEQAQEELIHVLELLQGHGDLRFEALTSTRLGYTLEASGQLAQACKLYERGRELHDQMGQHYYALNALAGLVRVADLHGDNTTALAHAQTIWETIAGKEMDATVETARTLRTCYTIFCNHDDPQAAEVLDMARSQLHRRASSIDGPEHVAQFWQLADHNFFQQISTQS